MKVQKFESVRLTVEAVQYTGENIDALKNFIGSSLYFDADDAPCILTKEGGMKISVSDWAVKEPFPTGDRDFYPVKAEIFAKRYAPAGLRKQNTYFLIAVIVITALLTGAVAGYMYAITHPF